MNFLITQYVEAGQYIVTVEGKSRSVTSAAYTLVTNFVEGATIDGGPTTPGTGDEVARLEARIADLQRDLNACQEPIATHARGELENPSGNAANPGYRSGISVISGWVCQAEEVEVQIFRDGVLRETLQVAQGTSRPDTVGQCRHRSANTGFGTTWNFNHLP